MKHAEMSAATRAALVSEFCSIYESTPLEKITVKEVASRANVSRVTFYNHFRDPYDLLNQVEDELIDVITEMARSSFDGRFEPELFFQSFVISAQENADLMRILLAGSHSGVFAEKIKLAAVPLVQTALGVDMEKPRARYTIEYHASGMVGLLKRWLLAGDVDAETLALCVRDLLMRGVLATLEGNWERKAGRCDG